MEQDHKEKLLKVKKALGIVAIILLIAGIVVSYFYMVENLYVFFFVDVGISVSIILLLFLRYIIDKRVQCKT